MGTCINLNYNSVYINNNRTIKLNYLNKNILNINVFIKKTKIIFIYEKLKKLKIFFKTYKFLFSFSV